MPSLSVLQKRGSCTHSCVYNDNDSKAWGPTPSLTLDGRKEGLAHTGTGRCACRSLFQHPCVFNVLSSFWMQLREGCLWSPVAPCCHLHASPSAGRLHDDHLGAVCPAQPCPPTTRGLTPGLELCLLICNFGTRPRAYHTADA